MKYGSIIFLNLGLKSEDVIYALYEDDGFSKIFLKFSILITDIFV